jgi:ABC-type sugar transport system permease subunit
LPLLTPALLVAALLRMLDAFRVFDIVFVITGGGPGTATEPLALYTFSTLFRTLRFGYGSAMAIAGFLLALLVALLFLGLFRRRVALEDRS